jgi:hypothetical protein
MGYLAIAALHGSNAVNVKRISGGKKVSVF